MENINQGNCFEEDSQSDVIYCGTSISWITPINGQDASLIASSLNKRGHKILQDDNSSKEELKEGMQYIIDAIDMCNEDALNNKNMFAVLSDSIHIQN